MKSDIWDIFVKFSEENRLFAISTTQEDKSKENLYNLKPETSKGMEYDNNISYYAHPNAVVVAPSYDKLNGLVENLNERQNIILNIVNKNNDGHLNQKKYAQQELILSLVRLGNYLDNSDQDELRLLADACLAQASIKKEAIAIGVATLIGAIYAQQHLSFRNEGFKKNHEKLIAEIDDFLNDSVNWGVGTNYTSKFLGEMREFKYKLLQAFKIYEEIMPKLQKLETPRNAKELMAFQKSSNGLEIIGAYKKFKQYFDNFLPYIIKIKNNFKNEMYKINQIQEKGLLEKAVDWTGILRGGKGLIADDFDDVARAITPYLESVNYILNVLDTAESYEVNAQRTMQDAMQQSYKSTKMPEDQVPVAETQVKEEPKQNFDLSLDNLNKQLDFFK